MSASIDRLSRAVQAELQQCLREGLSARRTRLRLAVHGVVVSERTAVRYSGVFERPDV
jgi:hypothetical protein